MECAAIESEGGFVEGLGHGGVGVHCRDDVFGGRFESDRQTELVDEFGGILADDVGAEDLTPRLARDDLHEAFGGTGGNCLAERCERKRADLDIVSRCPRGGFGQTDRSDLRAGIGTAWNGVVVNTERVVSSDPLDAGDGFFAGDMRQPRRTDDVADGVDTRQRRFVGWFIHTAVCDLDVAFFDVHVDAFAKEPVVSARDTNSYKYGIAFECFGLGLIGGVGDRHTDA